MTFYAQSNLTEERKLANVYEQKLKKRGIEAMLLIYRDKTTKFEDDYKEMFDFFKIGYIRLKENIDTNYLKKYFRTCQSLDTLIAMKRDNSKQVLRIITKTKKYKKGVKIKFVNCL